MEDKSVKKQVGKPGGEKKIVPRMGGETPPQITDLVLDERNANLGTKRGREMLARSLQEYGAGRSILIDKEGRVIAGNKTLAQAIEAGIEDLLVIETDGSQLVAVKRIDLDLKDGDKARKLAYADNRTSQVGLDWNIDQIMADLESGIGLTELFDKDEIDALLIDMAQQVESTECDKSIEDDVEFIECPKCRHRWPK